MHKVSFVFYLFVLQACAALLPADHPNLKPRVTTTTPAGPACTTNSDVVINGGFYGFPDPPSYAPWVQAPNVGSPGCRYLNGYTPCMGDNTFGSNDPNCLSVVLLI